MKAFVVNKPGATEIRELPIPRPGPYDALVRMELCVICNTTDRMVIEGTFKYADITYPCVLGHESVGTVIETGDRVGSFKIGDRVTRAGFRADDPAFPVGSAWGGFAEYGIVQDIEVMARDGIPFSGSLNQSSQVIPTDIGWNEAALLISLGETFSFMQKLGDLKGKNILIIGTGIAGLAFTFFAKLLGARQVKVVGRRRERLDLAKQLGADEIICTSQLTERPAGFPRDTDIVIEASGNPEALETVLCFLKEHGKVAMYAIADRPYSFPLYEAPQSFAIDQIVPEERTGIPALFGMLRQGAIPTGLLITNEWNLSEMQTALEQVRKGEVIKGIVWLGEGRASAK